MEYKIPKGLYISGIYMTVEDVSKAEGALLEYVMLPDGVLNQVQYRALRPILGYHLRLKYGMCIEDFHDEWVEDRIQIVDLFTDRGVLQMMVYQFGTLSVSQLVLTREEKRSLKDGVWWKRLWAGLGKMAVSK